MTPSLARAVAASLVLLAVACNDALQPRSNAGHVQLTAFAGAPQAGVSLVLRGTIVTPDGVIKHGYVGIGDGRIVSVSDKQPDGAEDVTINTAGIILPGFVDVHNHVPWNALPHWISGRTFTNRNQWRTDPAFQQAVGQPFDRVSATNFCDMNAWGELRALVGGTTSIMSTHRVACIHGLVRNLDFNSGFYGTTQLEREHVFNVIDVPPATDLAGRTAFVGAARFFIANPFYEALAVHLAEGTDAAAAEEFTFVQSQHLLNPKGVLIHGIPLGTADFQAMAATGTALVWSPRSNLELYGTTADVGAALDAGVEVALAPDWAISGSANMLDELKVASQWNREHLGGRLSDKALVDMATTIAARIVGVEDEVGTIRVGLRADLLVIGGDHNDPYRAVLDAEPSDVRLVLIDGVPLYGDRELMERMWAKADLDDVPLPGDRKALATPPTGLVIVEIAARLQAALQSGGTSLAPLFEVRNATMNQRRNRIRTRQKS